MLVKNSFGTEASVPAVPRYRFWFLLLDTRCLGTRFPGGYLHFSFSVLVRFHFGLKSGKTYSFGIRT